MNNFTIPRAHLSDAELSQKAPAGYADDLLKAVKYLMKERERTQAIVTTLTSAHVATNQAHVTLNIDLLNAELSRGLSIVTIENLLARLDVSTPLVNTPLTINDARPVFDVQLWANIKVNGLHADDADDALRIAEGLDLDLQVTAPIGYDVELEFNDCMQTIVYDDNGDEVNT